MQCFKGYSYTHRVNPTPQNFHIELLDSASGARIMKLTGPLTLQTLFEFQDVARRETHKPVIIDLTSVPYMDSAGLGSIVSVFTSSQRNGHGFAITGLSDRIRTLFQITRVDGFLPSFTSLEQAEASVTSL
jgi:anti-anti-sigma factor